MLRAKVSEGLAAIISPVTAVGYRASIGVTAGELQSVVFGHALLGCLLTWLSGFVPQLAIAPGRAIAPVVSIIGAFALAVLIVAFGPRLTAWLAKSSGATVDLEMAKVWIYLSTLAAIAMSLFGFAVAVFVAFLLGRSMMAVNVTLFTNAVFIGISTLLFARLANIVFEFRSSGIWFVFKWFVLFLFVPALFMVSAERMFR